MSGAEETVLASILPDRLDHLVKAMPLLEVERHFTDPTLREIFKLLRRYYDVAAGVLPFAVLQRILASSGWDAARRLSVEQTFIELSNRSVMEDGSDFRWAINEMREDTAKRETGAAIVEAMEILERGWTDPVKTHGRELHGHKEARAYVFEKLHDIERVTSSEITPEGDMRLEEAQALEDYALRASGQVKKGVQTGLHAIDQIGGLMDGELALMVAYTGQGKSMLVTQIAWHVATQQGRDVFFATTETIRAQVMRRVWARHSRLPQFECPGGLNAKDLKNGTLDNNQRKVFEAVLRDLRVNPNYGKLHLVQLPRDATVRYIETRLREFGKQVSDPALCVVDYFALVKPEVRRQQRREEYDEIINDAKNMATNFMDGRGIPVISPWSVHQSAFREAIQKRAYGLASLAETSNAEKASDLIMALLREEGSQNEAWLQFLKVRDGELPPTADLNINFKSTFLEDKAASSTFSTAASSSDVNPFGAEFGL